MNIPDGLLYTKTHEWARVEGDTAVAGITDFAQEHLGDLTFIELPAPGDQVEAGAEMGSIESVKAASELYSPVSGEVVEVNEALEADPGLANRDPYGEGWMVKVKLSGDAAGLMSPADYKVHAESEAH